MKYEFFRGKIEAKDAGTHQKLDLAGSFYLEPFKFNKFTLHRDQMKELIERFTGIKELTFVSMVSAVNSYLFENAGGTEETPLKEVMSWMYLSCSTRAFKTLDFVDELIQCVNIANMFEYIEASALTVPHQWSNAMCQSVAPQFWGVLIDKYDFKVDLQSTEEEAEQFARKIEADARQYISQTQVIDEMMDEFGLSNEQNN